VMQRDGKSIEIFAGISLSEVRSEIRRDRMFLAPLARDLASTIVKDERRERSIDVSFLSS